MRKTIAGFCTVCMLGLTLSVAAAQTPGNGYDDGNTFTNPWGTLFSTTTAKESKTTRKETTTETVTESGITTEKGTGTGTTTEATTSDNTSDSAGITTEEKNTGDNSN